MTALIFNKKDVEQEKHCFPAIETCPLCLRSCEGSKMLEKIKIERQISAHPYVGPITGFIKGWIGRSQATSLICCCGFPMMHWDHIETCPSPCLILLKGSSSPPLPGRARRGSSVCWTFHSYISGSLPCNIKHPEVSVVVNWSCTNTIKLNWMKSLKSFVYCGEENHAA